MVKFCTVQDVNDLLDTVAESGTSLEAWIRTGGNIDPVRVERLIETKSGNINSFHGMNFQKTLVSNEYHDTVNIPRIITDYYPIISISSLSLWSGSAYVVKIQGHNRITDDYFIEDSGAGKVRFWTTPSSYTHGVDLSYYYGYETVNIPTYVGDCCAHMVAIQIALSRSFREACKELFQRWKNVVADWTKIVEELMNEHIKKTPLSVHTLGKYSIPTTEQDLSDITS